MKISPKMKKLLVDEIKGVASRMATTEKPVEKLYFFSAAYGVAFRVMNIEFDPELSFVHLVLSAAHNMMTTNLASATQGQGMFTFPEGVFNELGKALEGLASNIERGEKTYLALEKVSNLAYSTTGNGYYLHLKGLLHV